jgi:hypothetical protein
VLKFAPSFILNSFANFKLYGVMKLVNARYYATFRFLPRRKVAYLLAVCLAIFLFTPASGAAEQAQSLELSRTARHVEVRLTVRAGTGTLRVHVSNDFGVSLNPSLPALGLRSQGLRVLSETWSTSRESMTMEVAGAAGSRYELGVRDPAQITSVDGAALERVNLQTGKLVIQLPSRGSEAYPHEKIVFHFVGESRAGNSKSRMP